MEPGIAAPILIPANRTADDYYLGGANLRSGWRPAGKWRWPGIVTDPGPIRTAR